MVHLIPFTKTDARSGYSRIFVLALSGSPGAVSGLIILEKVTGDFEITGSRPAAFGGRFCYAIVA